MRFLVYQSFQVAAKVSFSVPIWRKGSIELFWSEWKALWWQLVPWRPFSKVAATGIHFCHFRPLDCTFLYDNVTPFLCSIKNPYFLYLTCIYVINTRDSRQDGDKNGVKVRVFGILEHLDLIFPYNKVRPILYNSKNPIEWYMTLSVLLSQKQACCQNYCNLIYNCILQPELKIPSVYAPP